MPDTIAAYLALHSNNFEVPIATILAPALMLIGSFSFGWGTHSLFSEISVSEQPRGGGLTNLYYIGLTGLGLANFSLGILIGLQGFLSSLLLN